MQRYSWSKLTTQQVGAYAEYFVKMELTMFGFQVYTTEVDDRGVDFVARHGTRDFIEIQVKSVRSESTYVFMRKSKFPLEQQRHLALALLLEGRPPELYLIPSLVWTTPTAMFASRDYGEAGQVSQPEWGLTISPTKLPALDPYRFERAVETMLTPRS